MRHGSFESAICFSATGPSLLNQVFKTSRRTVRALVLGSALVVLSAPVAEAAGTQSRDHLRVGKSVGAPAGFVGVCERYFWACDKGAVTSKASAGRTFALAQRVNRAVNRQVREIADERQYNRQEYWALPTAYGGDCEDFALLKKRELIRHGIAAEDLLIATVLDRQRRAHAVLVLRTTQGDFVLDNLTNRILHWSDTGYSFLRMQDPRAPERWIAVFAGGMFNKSQARLGA